MGTLKFVLEKPFFIWAVIVAIYAAVFWGGELRHAPFSEREQVVYDVSAKFAESSFPPRIALIRELPDWGHLGFYSVEGRFFNFLKGDPIKLRAVQLVLMSLVFLIFVSLGFGFTYRNRLNPLWISLSLILFAANPYAWSAAYRIDYMALFLVLLLGSMFLFERNRVGWSAILLSVAILVDWRALCLAVAFVVSRFWGERSRLLRPERIISFIIPFLVAALPLLAWQAILPEGEIRNIYHAFRAKTPLFRPDGLFYVLALLPVYALYFSWSWGIRARARALVVGAIWAAIAIPFYFVFPIQPDYIAQVKLSLDLPLGLIDQGALAVAGPYKNILLFIPFIAGTFLFVQILLMDVLDRSQWLRAFVILFFAIQPLVIGVGDAEFLIVLPAILLFSLSEGIVGEQGKLA